MNIKIIGVIGAGVMGSGIAQNLAQTDHQVILIDISEDILLHTKQKIKDNIRFQKLFHKSADISDDILQKIVFSTDYQLLTKVDFIIENVSEKWETKKEVYAQLDIICSESCVFAANTSAIPITRIASLTKRPTQVIGMHFMNPVPMKKTVETIRGYHTSEKTIETAKQLLVQMGKDCIIVNDAPGFVANRLSHLFMNEAANLVMENVASPKDIDDIFKKCYGHAMGPLETADLIGLDTVVDTLQVLYENYQDSKFRCSPLLKKMIDAGLCGRKSGQGFYTY